MRPIRNGEEAGGSNLTVTQSGGLEHVKELWDSWEIHCLILLSLSLQIFLFLTADLRRRSASGAVRTVLWLAYLSADSVAVFALGHLAARAHGPGHELMLFWAPFVLVHLGGQDSITAFSKQDNELWRRHLLNLVTQAGVAGYVVSKSSWPDARLRAAMVLIFLSGLLKYAGRTCCLFLASPRALGATGLANLSDTVKRLQIRREKEEKEARKKRKEKGQAFKESEYQPLTSRFESMFNEDSCLEFTEAADDIMLVDAPVNDVLTIALADLLPDSLKEFKSRPNADRCMAYQYVAACLVRSYRYLYTKASLSSILDKIIVGSLESCQPFVERWWPILSLILACSSLTYTLFHPITTVTALVLFAAAGKEGHHSKVDVIVSYILLAGAIILDLLPALTSIVSHAREFFRLEGADDFTGLLHLMCFQPPGWRTRKKWSEELAQYSMVKRYTSSVPSLVKWIGTDLGATWCLKFFEVTRKHVTDDLKLAVIDKLFSKAMRKDWDFASFRGERALRNWMDNRNHWHKVFPESQGSGCALLESINSRVDFSTSILIWHIATDICYFTEDKGSETEPEEIIDNKKKMSRELSHYIMYLVFKCDVLLTSSSRLVHQKAHEGLKEILSASQQSSLQDNIDEKKEEEEQSTLPGQQSQDGKEIVIEGFEDMKEEEQQHGSPSGQKSPQSTLNEKEAVIQVFKVMKKQEGSTPPGGAQDNKNKESANKEIPTTTTSWTQSPQDNIDEKGAVNQVFEGAKEQEQQQGSPPEVVQDNKNEESANKDDATTSPASGILELLQSTEQALCYPVLPPARAVAEELIAIKDDAERWNLILEVWLEMLFYTAPRCGSAFHYEHLSTGGEFITHVLLLMRNLGPFLPKPGT